MNKISLPFLGGLAFVGFLILHAVLMVGEKRPPTLPNEVFDWNLVSAVGGLLCVTFALGFLGGYDVCAERTWEERDKHRSQWRRVWARVKCVIANLRFWKTGAAYTMLSGAMKKDPEYSHAWFCNIAMPIYDCAKGRLTLYESQSIADELMLHLFEVKGTLAFNQQLENPNRAAVPKPRPLWKRVASKLWPATCTPFGGLPEWAKDAVYVETEVQLSFLDRVRVLFSGRMWVKSHSYTENQPGRVETKAVAYPLAPKCAE